MIDSCFLEIDKFLGQTGMFLYTDTAFTNLLKLIVLGIVVLSSLLSGETDLTADEGAGDAKHPNILWIITDDQRPDSVGAYNQAVYGHLESPLGYVESPNVDRLASEGILFTKAYTNSPVCAPSRAALHSGRYPFRSGRYAFELSHQGPDFIRPVVSEVLRDTGYQTSMFGKEDHYIFKWGPGQGFHNAKLFDLQVHFKHHIQVFGMGDLFVKASYGDEKGNSTPVGFKETVVYPNGEQRSYFLKRESGELSPEDITSRKQTDEEFGLLRAYTRANTNLIIGGTNPKPAHETIDAYIVREFTSYLDNADTKYKTMNGREEQGADSSKPQFLQLGFHLPHTPVLPPKSIQDRFKDKFYRLPEFDKEELGKTPNQLQRVYKALKIDGLKDAEKQKAIQDYYAFCAHGDDLIGKAVKTFQQYCQKNNQPWVVVYTVGDHGWHLGENGIEGKCGPWRQSVNNAAIVVASDKSLVPAGLVNHDMVEFVDFAPTIMSFAGVDTDKPEFDYLDGVNMLDIVSNKVEKREYIVGEIAVICGQRAYLHSDRFRFSMKTRPFYGSVPNSDIGKNIKWALETSADKVEMALYDLSRDPLERNNIAYQEDYKELANWFRNKLGNIVLGDGRIEVDWSQENKFVLSDFARGAHDNKLDIPKHLLPK